MRRITLIINDDDEVIHIRDADVKSEQNMYNSIQILFNEIELNDRFLIPETVNRQIHFGYYAIKRRMKLK